MTKTATIPDPSTLRADARRNREKVLQTALSLFATEGPDVSLNEIARQAGVGVGTLYRHFPTRDHLVAAVYSNELRALGQAADDALATKTPDEALTAWGARFLEFATTKRGLGQALLAAKETGTVDVDPRAIMIGSMDKLIAAGREAGTIHADDVTGEDLMTALAGLWSMPHDDQFPVRARRLMDLVLGGLRHR